MTKHYILLATILLISCAGNKLVTVNSAQEEFNLGKKLFEEKEYEKAIDGFQNVIYKYPGSGLMEDAQFWLAETYFAKGDYEQAELEYTFLLKNFPNSRFTIKASYGLAITYYKLSPSFHLDQEYTKTAIVALNNFIARYGDTELAKEAQKVRIECIDKLVRKELETARLYKKMGKPEAALFYLDGILEKYPETTLKNEIEELRDKISL